MENDPMPPMPMPPRPGIMPPIPIEAICACSAASCWGWTPMAPGAYMPGFGAGRTEGGELGVGLFALTLGGAETVAVVEFGTAELFDDRAAKLGSGSAEALAAGSAAEEFARPDGGAAGAGSGFDA